MKRRFLKLDIFYKWWLIFCPRIVVTRLWWKWWWLIFCMFFSNYAIFVLSRSMSVWSPCRNLVLTHLQWHLQGAERNLSWLLIYRLNPQCNHDSDRTEMWKLETHLKLRFNCMPQMVSCFNTSNHWDFFSKKNKHNRKIWVLGPLFYYICSSIRRNPKHHINQQVNIVLF